uniref:NHR domain-containing protein n=1 Tax=Strigamia maritima TaxID=126957 RepID=T1IVE5_STRMM
MAVMFHHRTGALVTLSNNNCTAQRNHPAQEFNNGLVLSVEPLKDNILFEVRLDKKINSWSGSIEIGVTTSDPNILDFPSSATDLRDGSWIMSGSSVLCDGRSIIEEYGYDLDKLQENDRVGVMRTSQGDLVFFVNGISQGIAASNIPPTVFAVIDMYGKCAQVTSVNSGIESRLLTNEIVNENTVASSNLNHVANNISSNADRLRFHDHCGSLVKLSERNRTAERRRPLDEFNNGVVMTHRSLRDNELFEIRIDRLVDKWSGSIEVGITTHNPATLEFPATMTNMRSGTQQEGEGFFNGTIMMSGCGILTNGKGTRREYGEYNLDELVEGDKIGLMRKSNGNLHYYINNVDQGVAAVMVPQTVYGVVDLYGMTIQVTIVNPDEESIDHDLINRHNNNTFLRDFELLNGLNGTYIGYSFLLLIFYNIVYITKDDAIDNEADRLLFHPRCGNHATVLCGGRTAYRPNAIEDFNNAVVLTNRPLHTNELFEVVLENVVSKWAGSIEIGVTTHTPLELEFPATMTNVRSGTWMMTGNGIMHNGTTIIDEYGQSLDRLKVTDRVGVIRKDNGTLHFYVNGIDQGSAASNVPERVYGVIDLYGQAAQATLLDERDLPLSLPSNAVSATSVNELRFHHLHGRNIRISLDGLTASRPNAYGEFNDSIVMSNRPLQDDQVFEVIIEKMVDRWSGSIEAGVTAIKPEELEFPNTMTDIDYDTWMLSGSTVMQDGATVRNGYKCDLDSIGTGARVGMARHSDGTLHYYINGEEQGVACTDIPSNIYAVIDLYGQCAQVSIVPSSCGGLVQNELNAAISCPSSQAQALTAGRSETTHQLSLCYGKNIVLRDNNSTACRIRNFNHGLLFSALPLETEELFEVRIDQIARQWSGSLHIGLTTLSVSDTFSMSLLPSCAFELGGDTWLIAGSQVFKNNMLTKDNYGPSLHKLEVNDRIGIKRCSDLTMHITINGEDLGCAASYIPKKIFAVIDLYGAVEAVSVTSRCKQRSATSNDVLSNSCQLGLSSEVCSVDSIEAEIKPLHNKEQTNSLEFYNRHGRNIQLSNHNLTASRSASYNQGIVVCRNSLVRGQLFQIRIERLNSRWTSSLIIGVVAVCPDIINFPLTALGLKKSSWVICSDCVFHNGVKVRGQYGPNLDTLQIYHVVGILVDTQNRLHLYVNGVDQGVAAQDIPLQCYAVADLYGQCEQIVIINGEGSSYETDYREKADIDDGVKEKIYQPITNDQLIMKNCQYKNLCRRFKAVLGIPEAYFQSENNYTCYCEICHKIRGEELYHKKGDPPKDFALPFGWCKFALKSPHKADNAALVDKWHVAFHGTKLGEIRKILDFGELLLPSEIGLETSLQSLSQKNKDSDGDGTQIYFSPTIRYAGHVMFAPNHEFTDPKTKRLLHTHVAFQILVRPGSYKIGPQRIGAREPIDSHFSNSDVEWFTKEKGATVLNALLIKIDGF